MIQLHHIVSLTRVIGFHVRLCIHRLLLCLIVQSFRKAVYILGQYTVWDLTGEERDDHYLVSRCSGNSKFLRHSIQYSDKSVVILVDISLSSSCTVDEGRQLELVYS